MEDPSENYEVSLLLSLPPEYLLGDEDSPGPLVRLAYPEVLRLRLLSSKFRDLIDNDYFWELKTRRDWGAENAYPNKTFTDSKGGQREAQNWREEYLSYGQSQAPELLNAAREGEETQVQELLDLGVNPNTRDKHERTALILASLEGHLEVVKVLLAAGADVNTQDRLGYTALMWASDDKHLEVVKVLLAEGADVNIQNLSEDTALIEASSGGHPEVVKRLLSARAEVDAQTKYGDTAPMLASRYGHSEVMKVLRAAGAG